jgi:membrane dipeptidase
MAQILGLEGGFDMDGDLDVLRLFYRLGVRMIQFVNHRTTNAFADSYEDVQKWRGINAHGRKVIREMNRLGILIDISHATEATQLQVIEASEAPVVASHVGMRQFSNHPQNLSDEVLKNLAAKGGMIGIHGHGSLLKQK